MFKKLILAVAAVSLSSAMSAAWAYHTNTFNARRFFVAVNQDNVARVDMGTLVLKKWPNKPEVGVLQARVPKGAGFTEGLSIVGNSLTLVDKDGVLRLAAVLDSTTEEPAIIFFDKFGNRTHILTVDGVAKIETEVAHVYPK